MYVFFLIYSIVDVSTVDRLAIDLKLIFRNPFMR